MNSYRIVLFLHIASAMLLLGGSLAGVLVRSAARRSMTLGELAAVLALGRPLSVMNPLSALSLLATGIYLTSVGHWWAQPWVRVAVAVWIVNALIAKAAVGGVVDRLVDCVREGVDGPLTGAVEGIRRSAVWTLGGDLLVALDLAMVFLMTLRLPLLPSLSAVAAAVGVVLTLGGVRGLRRTPGAAVTVTSGS